MRQETRGIKVEFGRDISRLSSVTLTFNNLHVHQQERPTAAGLPIVNSTFTNNSVALGGVRDFRDSPFVPTRGDIQAITAQWAGGALKGSSSFRKVDFASSWYLPVRGTWVLATRVRAGIIVPRRGEADLRADSLGTVLPLNDRFRSGGVNSVRGYQENTIASTGGVAILQGNIELRVPIFRALGAEALRRRRECLGQTVVREVERLHPDLEPEADRRQRGPLRDRDRPAAQPADRAAAFRRELGIPPDRR